MSVLLLYVYINFSSCIISKTRKTCNRFTIQSCVKQVFRILTSRPRQGWIQTSATSFQKLVRFVKKLLKKTQKAVPEYLNARCQFLPGVQLQNLLIPIALRKLRTSALSFTEPSPHPSPSPSVDLCSICALVQIFYCFLCTSQNSLSLAEHNCAPVKVSFHWLLRFSALVVN